MGENCGFGGKNHSNLGGVPLLRLRTPEVITISIPSIFYPMIIPIISLTIYIYIR
jgi:hypothetical protein